MRVLMFGWEFPPFNSGGLGVACEGLSRALARRGEELIFVLPKKAAIGGAHARFLFAEDVVPGIFDRVITISSAITPYPAAQSRSRHDGVHDDEIYGPGLLGEVRRYARAAALIAGREKFDVIHAHDWLSFVAGIAAKQVSGKPLIVHVHATEYDRAGGVHAHPDVRRIEEAGFAAADRIIAVSAYTKEQIVHYYGVASEKIIVCHNGIDETPPPPKDSLPLKRAHRKKIVLFVGRITLQKGPDYFLRAAELVSSYEPDAFFVIAGSGDMERQIIAQSVALGLASRVIFAGFLRGEELRRMYGAADLFVLSSVSEPFGLTALEAAQAGVPVILSRQSGVSELLRHCLLVDFWDVRVMASQILAALRYPALRTELADNARAEVKQYSWDRSAARCLAAYREFLPASMA